MAVGFLDRVHDYLIKVGPKGYIHGWIFVGAPGVGDIIHHSGAGIRPGQGRGTVSHVDDHGHVHVTFDNGNRRTFEHVASEGPAQFGRRKDIGGGDKLTDHMNAGRAARRRQDYAAAAEHHNAAAEAATHPAIAADMRARAANDTSRVPAVSKPTPGTVPTSTAVRPREIPTSRHEEHLAAADDALRRGDRAAAINHLTEAGIHAPDKESRTAANTRRNALAGEVMHGTPSGETVDKPSDVARAPEVPKPAGPLRMAREPLPDAEPVRGSDDEQKAARDINRARDRIYAAQEAGDRAAEAKHRAKYDEAKARHAEANAATRADAATRRAGDLKRQRTEGEAERAVMAGNHTEAAGKYRELAQSIRDDQGGYHVHRNTSATKDRQWTIQHSDPHERVSDGIFVGFKNRESAERAAGVKAEGRAKEAERLATINDHAAATGNGEAARLRVTSDRKLGMVDMYTAERNGRDSHPIPGAMTDEELKNAVNASDMVLMNRNPTDPKLNDTVRGHLDAEATSRGLALNEVTQRLSAESAARRAAAKPEMPGRTPEVPAPSSPASGLGYHDIVDTPRTRGMSYADHQAASQARVESMSDDEIQAAIKDSLSFGKYSGPHHSRAKEQLRAEAKQRGISAMPPKVDKPVPSAHIDAVTGRDTGTVAAGRITTARLEPGDQIRVDTRSGKPVSTQRKTGTLATIQRIEPGQERGQLTHTRGVDIHTDQGVIENQVAHQTFGYDSLAHPGAAVPGMRFDDSGIQTRPHGVDGGEANLAAGRAAAASGDTSVALDHFRAASGAAADEDTKATVRGEMRAAVEAEHARQNAEIEEQEARGRARDAATARLGAEAPASPMDRFSPQEQATIRNAVADHAAQHYGGPFNMGRSDAARYTSEGPLKDLTNKHDLKSVWQAVDHVIGEDPSVLTRSESERAAGKVERTGRAEAKAKEALTAFQGNDLDGASRLLDEGETIDPAHRYGAIGVAPGRSWDQMRDAVARRRDANNAPQSAVMTDAERNAAVDRVFDDAPHIDTQAPKQAGEAAAQAEATSMPAWVGAGDEHARAFQAARMETARNAAQLSAARDNEQVMVDHVQRVANDPARSVHDRQAAKDLLGTSSLAENERKTADAVAAHAATEHDAQLMAASDGLTGYQAETGRLTDAMAQDTAAGRKPSPAESRERSARVAMEERDRQAIELEQMASKATHPDAKAALTTRAQSMRHQAEAARDEHIVAYGHMVREQPAKPAAPTGFIDRVRGQDSPTGYAPHDERVARGRELTAGLNEPQTRAVHAATGTSPMGEVREKDKVARYQELSEHDFASLPAEHRQAIRDDLGRISQSTATQTISSRRTSMGTTIRGVQADHVGEAKRRLADFQEANLPAGPHESARFHRSSSNFPEADQIRELQRRHGGQAVLPRDLKQGDRILVPDGNGGHVEHNVKNVTDRGKIRTDTGALLPVQAAVRVPKDDGRSVAPAAVVAAEANIPIRKTKTYWADRLRTAHATPGLHIIENTPTSRAAMSDELTRLGVGEMSPLRGVLENFRGSHHLFRRNTAGGIDAGIDYTQERKYKELHINDMRVLPQRQGIGTQMLTHLAREHPDHTMDVHGAVGSAKPWYAKTGATMTSNSGYGEWNADAMAGLRAGSPINRPYSDPVTEVPKPTEAELDAADKAAVVGRLKSKLGSDFTTETAKEQKAARTDARREARIPSAKDLKQEHPHARAYAEDVQASAARVAHFDESTRKLQQQLDVIDDELKNGELRPATRAHLEGVRATGERRVQENLDELDHAMQDHATARNRWERARSVDLSSHTDAQLEDRFHRLSAEDPDEVAGKLEDVLNEMDRRGAAQSEIQSRIDAATARGVPYRDAYADAHGLDADKMDRDERAALVDSARRAGESREQAVRRMYAEHVHLQHLAAEADTNGHLLTPVARSAGIDPTGLFSGSADRARVHASEDLKRWWEQHPRSTYAQFRAEILGGASDRRTAAQSRLAANGRDFGV